jgi:hypothetical protein
MQTVCAISQTPTGQISLTPLVRHLLETIGTRLGLTRAQGINPASGRPEQILRDGPITRAWALPIQTKSVTIDPRDNGTRIITVPGMDTGRAQSCRRDWIEPRNESLRGHSHSKTRHSTVSPDAEWTWIKAELPSRILTMVGSIQFRLLRTCNKDHPPGRGAAVVTMLGGTTCPGLLCEPTIGIPPWIRSGLLLLSVNRRLGPRLRDHVEANMTATAM